MKHFRLFANCIPVKGYTRSLVCDTQRHTFDFIPNSLYDILTDPDITTLEALKEKHEHQYDEVIDEYFDFLQEKEYVFFTTQPQCFPDLDRQWHYPFAISNSIIDMDEHSGDITERLDWLEPVHCRNVQVRYFRPLKPQELAVMLGSLQQKESAVQFLQVLLPYDPAWTPGLILKYYRDYPRLSNLSFYDAPEDRFVPPANSNRGYTIYSSRHISSCGDCGNIEARHFAVNVQNLTEALQFNSCLNRKISIDTDGSIKNCPGMGKSFGHIDTHSIGAVLEQEAFTAAWHIRKDQVSTCRDCEFRYICTDCRAYVENPEDPYSKPLKCGYDPYTGEWQDWAVVPEKQAAIDFYGFKNSTVA